MSKPLTQPTLLQGTEVKRSGAFQALLQLILPGTELATPTSQTGEITKYFPRKTHCKLWLGFFGWELEGTGADAGDATSAQPRFTPTSELSIQPKLTYTCITGHATTPHFSC